MYSAMILSVYGVMSKFKRSSILLIVLLSDLTADTLNLAELLPATFLFCFHKNEPYILEVMVRVMIKFFGMLMCPGVEGANICAIFTFSLESQLINVNNFIYSVELRKKIHQSKYIEHQTTDSTQTKLQLTFTWRTRELTLN